MRVFARDGYHTSRVGDIAEEAGIAHGLLYHYFSSKDEVLATVFRENWGELLERFHAVEMSDEPADEKLRGIAKILLRTWRNDPALVTVMVREVARSPHLQEQVDEVSEGFLAIQRVIEQGQAAGDVPGGHRPAAGELGLLRRPGGVAHGLGAGPAPRRRGGGRACRAHRGRGRLRWSRRRRRCGGLTDRRAPSSSSAWERSGSRGR